MKDFKNDLLNRREIELVVIEKSNPGFQNSTKLVADQFKVNEEVIAVKTIKSKFGINSFLIDAFIYNSVVDKEKIEPKKKQKKKAEGEAK